MPNLADSSSVLQQRSLRQAICLRDKLWLFRSLVVGSSVCAEHRSSHSIPLPRGRIWLFYSEQSSCKRRRLYGGPGTPALQRIVRFHGIRWCFNRPTYWWHTGGLHVLAVEPDSNGHPSHGVMASDGYWCGRVLCACPAATKAYSARSIYPWRFEPWPTVPQRDRHAVRAPRHGSACGCHILLLVLLVCSVLCLLPRYAASAGTCDTSDEPSQYTPSSTSKCGALVKSASRSRT